MDYAAWALGQVDALRPGATGRVWPSIQDLVNALTALRKPKAEAQLFGLSASNVAAEHYPAIDAAVVEALREWHARFEAADDVRSLLDLDKVGRRLDVPGLCLKKRFPLRCDPLGTRDGVAADWLRRLEKLDDAIAGGRALDAHAVRFVGAEESTPKAVFGAPDEAALYDFAIRYETGARRAFPRELAAFWTTANGIFLDDIPLLRSIGDWRDEDRGWAIGCGSYEQGELSIAETKKAGLLEGKVTDRDDDGVVLAKYANIGAFIDALLGA